MLLLPQHHLLLSLSLERERERETLLSQCWTRGIRTYAKHHASSSTTSSTSLSLSRERERKRDPPFAMLDQGNSYLCEASCFFFHNIIYFSVEREREREKERPSFRNAGPGEFVPMR